LIRKNIRTDFDAREYRGALGVSSICHPRQPWFPSAFIGGLTMKQRKNIVKQARNKDM
jgi:hypothetical protein